ncbi:MAG: hypothetical protein IJJ42_03050 [Clostridia bacterium]|nr:hypothetical protein [Clostridia bacterium]MBQ6382564.1 hypothetical protein [Clostridia bacterium]
MLEDLEKYHGTVLVWAGLGGGSISLPYLAHEAFDRVEPIEELELTLRDVAGNTPEILVPGSDPVPSYEICTEGGLTKLVLRNVGLYTVVAFG